MCTYSMIMEHGLKDLGWFKDNTNYWPTNDLRIAELERKVAFLEELLRAAKQYDINNNEPDCELDDKKKLLEKLAGELGVKITIP